MTDQPKPRLCAHADDGGGAHVLAAGETCDRASAGDTLTRAPEPRAEKRWRIAEHAAHQAVLNHMTLVCQDGEHERCAYGRRPDAFDCLCECHDEPGEPHPDPRYRHGMPEHGRYGDAR